MSNSREQLTVFRDSIGEFQINYPSEFTLLSCTILFGVANLMDKISEGFNPSQDDYSALLVMLGTLTLLTKAMDHLPEPEIKQPHSTLSEYFNSISKKSASGGTLFIYTPFSFDNSSEYIDYKFHFSDKNQDYLMDIEPENQNFTDRVRISEESNRANSVYSPKMELLKRLGYLSNHEILSNPDINIMITDNQKFFRRPEFYSSRNPDSFRTLEELREFFSPNLNLN